MKKILFIDRDGTIIQEPEDFQIDSTEKLAFLSGAISGLKALAADGRYRLVMVTNQDGLGTASFPEETFWPAHQLMLRVLEAEGIVFDEILIDRSFPAENASTRKPRTGLLTHYIEEGFDLENSYVLGDRATDIELAKNLGCKGIRIAEENDPEASLTTTSWEEITRFLLAHPSGKATVSRKTHETEIEVSLDLNAPAQADLQTGLGFLDHMLHQLARHGNLALRVHCKGDLFVDEHHSMEDIALALGEAFRRALGNKKGLTRYGHSILPMDECLATVAVDFGGRPWCVWKADFQREKIGDTPTEMFSHFFKSFSDEARCNLYLKVEGENEHHKIEALFKAWARAIRMAVSPSGIDALPSTKGVL